LKKTINFIWKSLLGLILLVFVLYTGFRIKEYFIGNKYVSYLENHSLVKSPIEDTLQLKFDNNFYNNNLFLVGELHEVETSPIIDVAMFKNLHQEINIDAYIGEMDIAQSYYLNEYLKNSSSLDLDSILRNWVINIGQISKSYRNGKWQELKYYYQTLPDNQKFRVFGVDKISDFNLVHSLLSEKLPGQYQIPKGKKELIEWGADNIPKILSDHEFEEKDLLLIENIHFNLSNLEKIKYRDEFMLQNFQRYYQQNNWLDKKLYGCFGFYHTLQGLENTFAGKLKNSKDLDFKEKIVTVNAIYTDSHLTVLSSYLPTFIADNTEYTKLPFSHDSMFDFYVVGIEDFKRVSNKNSINLYQLNAKNSPYHSSLRGISNFSLLPFWGSIDIKDKNTVTTDYFQYVIVVNGADWIQP